MPETTQGATIKKVFLRLMPVLFISYILAYIDRINIGFAAIRMNVDLGISPYIYGLGALTTYRFRPEVVDGGRLGMVEARSWTERVLGWVGSSMRPGASAGCWASGCRGNARRNGRTSHFWLRPC